MKFQFKSNLLDKIRFPVDQWSLFGTTQIQCEGLNALSLPWLEL